ncbi:hypothetical protein UFOVP1296_15 [uncultured Caudovirales phage]|uniref:Uncharacterized protein n=1 Tax=uncultured Caudovirales phage TaxID=2100421 RepID=A0A6J5MDX2_9CAUD|nr:hypothetical protein UFOVP471_79 [uncultured Caudovirales phage]CAB4169345.1 hypothetical protein UFOVP890_15 [uncultured Caudovirales phage]CAB4195475.1 hypothetical protein UFOVP1296_15 [uncultured Caudovirales phage]
MEIDSELLRRYAGMILAKMKLDQAKQMGFVQDANDELLWNEAMTDPQSFVQDAPDTEIVNPELDTALIDEILSRISTRN